ncbi:hypothetical protein BCR32DRAFT_246967 [Anaeromyces robustus]|uniref:Uncharacterized protein n=1 Tax=Anaeromyces robustus TaxID=1754192 RepID=A0A1Y1WYN1_9FUNG|nr:hypothetical protein BCR32DRAFT_246967 [Anaeromyces robustus]|eukprot:ORX78679.1 hypothetical protein BCR32DRAFT_246967 [Anaeromyces robustus]
MFPLSCYKALVFYVTFLFSVMQALAMPQALSPSRKLNTWVISLEKNQCSNPCGDGCEPYVEECTSKCSMSGNKVCNDSNVRNAITFWCNPLEYTRVGNNGWELTKLYKTNTISSIYI